METDTTHIYNSAYLYPDFEWTPPVRARSTSNTHDEARFENPSPSQGISAVLDNGAQPEERIAFSLIEVKAFKYLYRQDASNLAENIDSAQPMVSGLTEIRLRKLMTLW